jgi:type VI secretion system secreted protein VgrG
MAEYDGASRLVTGRQAAHVELFRRYPNDKAPAGEQKKPMPDVSVVEWEVHEKVCEPYRIRLLISTPGPLSRRDILGQWARFKFQTQAGAPVRLFRGLVSRFHSVSSSRDGCTYRVVIRQRLALLDGPSNCATYQDRTSAEIVREVMERHENRFWMRVELRLRRQHPGHRFRFQYNMGDWAWCRLEMEQAGLGGGAARLAGLALLCSSLLTPFSARSPRFTSGFDYHLFPAFSDKSLVTPLRTCLSGDVSVCKAERGQAGFVRNGE